MTCARVAYIELLTNDAFLGHQLLLLPSSLFKLQSFHFVPALLQLPLQSLDSCLVVTRLI